MTNSEARKVIDRILQCTKKKDVYQFQIGDEIEALQTALSIMQEYEGIKKENRVKSGEITRLNCIVEGYQKVNKDLQAELAKVKAENKRLSDCHDAELGVCQEHCEVIKEIAEHRKEEFECLAKEIDRLQSIVREQRVALEKIVKHMKFVIPSGYKASTIYNIAQICLDQLEDKK